MLTSESSSVRRPSRVGLDDEPYASAGDPLRWPADPADEVWVDWQLCPTPESVYEVARSALP